jgi:hypothetical protein
VRKFLAEGQVTLELGIGSLFENQSLDTVKPKFNCRVTPAAAVGTGFGSNRLNFLFQNHLDFWSVVLARIAQICCPKFHSDFGAVVLAQIAEIPCPKIHMGLWIVVLTRFAEIPCPKIHLDYIYIYIYSNIYIYICICKCI